MTALTNNKKVLQFVEESAAIATPDQIVWIDGSEEQRAALKEEAVRTGELIRLNQEKRGGQNVHLLPQRRGRHAPFHRQVDGSQKGV